MKKPQALNKRPFDINDGELYVVVVMDNSKTRYVTELTVKSHVRSKPDPTQAKVFSNIKSAEKIVDILLDQKQSSTDLDDRVFFITKVKEVMQPEYVIQYSDSGRLKIFNTELNAETPPELLAYITWAPKDETEVKANQQRFIDYESAVLELNEKKKLLIEYYYKKITEIRNIELKKI